MDNVLVLVRKIVRHAKVVLNAQFAKVNIFLRVDHAQPAQRVARNVQVQNSVQNAAQNIICLEKNVLLALIRIAKNVINPSV
jgi:hypothetical protein